MDERDIRQSNAERVEAAPLLAVEGIDKGFPGVRALSGVSFELRAGEIHGLVGENGAGKSTLMRILAGVYRPDAGTLRLRGGVVTLASPAEARRLGISMVYQDTRLVGELDVAQNVWLGREPTDRLGFVDRAELDRRTVALLARLGLPLHPRRRVATLSVAERQVVEIARALAADAAVLILDEPTSALDSAETTRLFALLRSLRDAGTGVVFISHRLPEVLALTDRITVLRDGELVATLPTATATTTAERLVGLMVGEREVSTAFPPRAATLGESLLEVRGFASPGRFRDVSFAVRAGEIVGIGGIEGEGQREIVRALFGLLPTTGELRIDGRPVAIGSPRAAIAAGLVYLSNDRRGEALLPPHSIRENVALPHLRRWSRAAVVDGGEERAAVGTAVDRLRVRAPSVEQPVELLSGGNQQKVAIGRWLLAQPRLYVFDEPTQGVDVGTKLDLYRLLRGLASEGAGVIVLSADVIELIGLSDRILVVAGGRIVDEVEAATATDEQIVGSAVTASRDGEAAGLLTSTAALAASGGPAWLGWAGRRWGSVLFVLGLILILGAITRARSDYFLTPANLSDLAIQVVPLALVALGQLFVVLLGGVDLSVGPTVSLTTAIASHLIVSDATGSVLFGVVACLAAGLAVGAVNAALIRFGRIPDLLATLATYSVVFGLALVVRPSPGGLLGFVFVDAVTRRVGLVPVAAVATLILVLAAEVFLLRTRAGTALYATGAAREAAFVAGIPVDRVRTAAYLASGLLAAVAGLVVAARIGSGDPQVGTTFTLAAVTAVVVGGASVFGGRGSALGALAGAVLLLEMQNALNYLRVSAYYQYVWTGLLTLVAVAAYAAWGRGGSLRRPRRQLVGPARTTEGRS